jgi:hypothetical protein
MVQGGLFALSIYATKSNDDLLLASSREGILITSQVKSFREL